MTAPPPKFRPIRIAIDPSVDAWLPEIRYTLRTVFGTAGLAIELDWYSEECIPDVYYGPKSGVKASVVIPAVPWGFGETARRTPVRVTGTDEAPELVFDQGPAGRTASCDGVLHLGTDAMFGAFWLLTAPEEPTLKRDRWDNLDAGSTSVARLDLLARPAVSCLASTLKAHLDPTGQRTLPWPWESARFALALSHDVDYPEIIRWIEVLRSLGRGRADLAMSVATGRASFWKFDDWVELAAGLGGQPAFYFMARRGSLLEYARGRPDAFYEVSKPRFCDLFNRLRTEGCEIGLHASFDAHLDEEQMRRERERLEALSGSPILGNRHHYWHLDPDAPHETLRRHGKAGLTYDSSLAFETHPGFRRGICHPFRPFHPERREPIDCVQLPPAWMDDHFDRRREDNGIADPEAAASRIVQAVERTAGALVLDYHPRGMNADFFPAYGPWLRDFSRRHLQGVDLRRPIDLAQMFLEREQALDVASQDRTATRETL